MAKYILVNRDPWNRVRQKCDAPRFPYIASFGIRGNRLRLNSLLFEKLI